MNITQALKEKWETRRDRYRVIERRTLPPFQQLQENFFLGGYSITLPGSRLRYMRRADAVHLGDMMETPTTAARDYLALLFGKAPRILKAKKDKVETFVKRPGAWPLYAQPCEFSEGCYVDVRRAFFSILLVSGWDVSYSPGDYLSFGRAPTDFPFANSHISRDALVSTGVHEQIPLYIPSRPDIKLKLHNQLYHPQMFLLIRDVLHGIAFDAIRAGAVYAAMDGYICPDRSTANRVLAVVQDWGLSARIKGEGPGAVWDTRAYRVGALASIRQEAKGGAKTKNMVHSLDYRRWLQARFASVAAGRAYG